MLHDVPRGTVRGGFDFGQADPGGTQAASESATAYERPAKRVPYGDGILAVIATGWSRRSCSGVRRPSRGSEPYCERCLHTSGSAPPRDSTTPCPGLIDCQPFDPSERKMMAWSKSVAASKGSDPKYAGPSHPCGSDTTSMRSGPSPFIQLSTSTSHTLAHVPNIGVARTRSITRPTATASAAPRAPASVSNPGHAGQASRTHPVSDPAHINAAAATANQRTRAMTRVSGSSDGATAMVTVSKHRMRALDVRCTLRVVF